MTPQLRLFSLLPAAALAACLLGLIATGCALEGAESAPPDEISESTEAAAPTAVPTPLDTGADARRERTLGDGAFEVRFGDQGGFDETSDEAIVEIAEPAIVALEADDWYARVSGTGLPETGEGSTDTLDSLDTTISLEVAQDGERVQVNCYAADPPQGTFQRTELTEGWISGSFRVEIVRCDGFFSQEIDFPAEPFEVTGRYRRLPRTDGRP